MEKLYKKIEGKLHYHEGWTEKGEITEHWGVAGERGETRETRPGVEIERVDGHWVNWKAKHRAAVQRLLEMSGDDTSERNPAGKYIGTTGGWDLGRDIEVQRAWDKRKRS